MAAVVAAERGAPGVYNIVDDDPAPVAEWLPYLAECLGARPPRHVPAWIARFAIGEVGVSMMTQIRGASNAKAQARARLGARMAELARGFRLGARRHPGAYRGLAWGMMHTTVSSREPHLADVYEDLRPLLFSISYRMLGSVSEAEDVVQETFLRYHRAVRDGDAEIESPKAYLSAVATRLSIDQLRSARVRREQYVGEWLPEPLVTDGPFEDVAGHAEEADSLSMAFLLVLERLSPVERAVFLLHDVFDYGYDEVARIVDRDGGELPSARGAGPPARDRA